jgi:hypothetical protein
VLGLTSAALLSALLYTADAAFVAGALSRLLGRHVEIGSIAFRPGASLEVEVAKLRILETAASDSPPLLEVEHAVGRQAWPRLLAGQLLPLDWVVNQPVLRLHAAEAGAPGVDFASLPRLGLSVHDGEITYQPRSGDAWAVHGLSLEASRAGFGTRVEGTASARITRGANAVTELALRFAADRKHVDMRGTVAGLELAPLPQTMVSARGAASGSFDLAYTYDGGDVAGRVDLEFSRLSLRMAALDRPVAPARAKLELDVDWKGSVLSLGLRPLVLDDVVANGSFTLDTSSPGRVALDVKLAPFEPGRRDRLNPLALLAMKIDTWKKVAAQIDAGTVEDIHLRIDVPRTTAAAQLAFDAPLRPEEFELELSARDGIYRPNPRTVLGGMSGKLEIHGDVLAISGLHMTEDGEPVPEVNVRIDGLARLANLPDDENEVVGGPGAKLAGLAAAVEGFRGDEDQSAAEPPSLLFTDLALRYPAFVMPLREASGRLRFPEGGVVAQNVRGVLGGAPAELDVKWDPTADRIDVDVRYLEGVAPGQPVTGPRWLSANVALEELKIGDLRLTQVRSRLDVEGTGVHFSEMSGGLEGGAVTGAGNMSLGEAGKAPFRFDLDVRGFDAAPLAGAFGLPEQSIKGTGHAKGHVAGPLRTGGRFATDGELAIGVALKDGSISNMPVLVALARLPSLSGVSGLLGRPLPYDDLVADFKLANGKLEISDAKLLGPQLRMLGSGEIDLNTPTKESDLVVALLFLQTLDSVIGSLPIVRNVVLGKDRNLLALYFRLSGPRDDLRVTPLAPERLRDLVGFASSAVMQGVRTLGRLIPGAGGGPDETPAPDPAPAPSPAPP